MKQRRLARSPRSRMMAGRVSIPARTRTDGGGKASVSGIGGLALDVLLGTLSGWLPI
jgi:hypothetical protein